MVRLPARALWAVCDGAFRAGTRCASETGFRRPVRDRRRLSLKDGQSIFQFTEPCNVRESILVHENSLVKINEEVHSFVRRWWAVRFPRVLLR